MAACGGGGMTKEALMKSLKDGCKTLVIASSSCDEAIQFFSCRAGGLDCFASLAMTTELPSGRSDLSRGADRRQRRWSRFALLQPEERGVAAAAAQQIVVTAAFDDFAVLDHQDGVGMHDGVQAV